MRVIIFPGNALARDPTILDGLSLGLIGNASAAAGDCDAGANVSNLRRATRNSRPADWASTTLVLTAAYQP